MEYDIVFPEDEVPATDTSPVKLPPETDPTPDALMAKAALKAKELARLRHILSHEGRQQLRKVSKQKLKSKNQRRRAIAAQSRKRNR